MRDAGCGMRQDGTACKTWVPSDGPSLADCTMRAGCGKGGFSFSLPDPSELVILSAAGAKDLLFRRCEDLFRAPQARGTCFPMDARTFFGCRRREDLFRAPQARTTYVAASKNSRSFARARAARALRMTTPHAVSGKR